MSFTLVMSLFMSPITIFGFFIPGLFRKDISGTIPLNPGLSNVSIYPNFTKLDVKNYFSDVMYGEYRNKIFEFSKKIKKIIKIITIKKLGENKTFTDAVGESEKDARDARKNKISKGFVCMVTILWAKGVLLGLKLGLGF